MQACRVAQEKQQIAVIEPLRYPRDNGIVLKTRIQKSHIRTDFRIFDFLTGYQYKKSEAELSLDGKMVLIAQAIKEKARLSMTYLKANDTKSERTVIPITVGKASYQGKEYPGMKAFCTKAGEERMFRVDRILKVEKITTPANMKEKAYAKSQL